MTPLAFDRSVCTDLTTAQRREWLVTNGLGGYASSTVGGLHTRRYHGLLVAALDPPLGRTVTLSKLEEVVSYAGRRFALSANRWADGTIAPTGFELLQSFALEGSIPRWRFAVADTLVDKRVWMEHGANTTYVQYTMVQGNGPLQLDIVALMTYRGHHATTRSDGWSMEVEAGADDLSVAAFEGATKLRLRATQGQWQAQHDWYLGLHLAAEAHRGLEHSEDVLAVGRLRAALEPGSSLTVWASTERRPPSGEESVQGALHRRRIRDRSLVAQAGDPADEAVRRLCLAADQFIVSRPTATDREGASVIAGYPWFADWGRDTMIALPGLTLATGRPAVCAAILRTFAEFVDEGMLPNRFVGRGETPRYNTVDATLWLFEALRQYVASTGDWTLVSNLRPTLHAIIDAHRRGTRYGIRLDETDHLLRAGTSGVQLTWMDAKVGDWVVTPRIGKPVEVNALWLNALRLMSKLAARNPDEDNPYAPLCAATAAGMRRFWNCERGYCYDVLDGPGGHETALRPNQLIALALPDCPWSAEQQRSILQACTRELYTPMGVRSLGPAEPEYRGRYQGPPAQRDGAYHQGTAWPWLVGPLVQAHLRLGTPREQVRAWLEPLIDSMADHGVGSVAEIADAQPPHRPRGCIAQAWSVASLLASWKAVSDEE